MPDQQQLQRPPQTQEPAPWSRKDNPFEGGPRSTEKPDTSSILKKLRRVDSGQAKKYRQRSGQ